MNQFPNRIVVYPKDVQNITGRKARTARKLLSRIRKTNKKEKGAFVSVDEFCAFTGLKEEYVRKFLR